MPFTRTGIPLRSITAGDGHVALTISKIQKRSIVAMNFRRIIAAIFMICSFILFSFSYAMAQSNIDNRNNSINKLNGFEVFSWGMHKDKVELLAKEKYGSIDKRSTGIIVQINRNKEWFELRFTGNRLSSVLYRYNTDKNQNFSKRINDSYIRKYGKPNTKKIVDDKKYYTWLGQSTKVISYSLNSDYFVEVEFTPTKKYIKTFTIEDKRNIWSHYKIYENISGPREAEVETAKFFMINKSDIVNIKKECSQIDCTVPQGKIKNEQESYEERRKREKRNVEFGAELYRQAEKFKSGY